MTTEPPTFATVLSCIDGRVQVPVNETVRALFGVSVVDTITAPGIVRFLSDETYMPEARAALSCARISIEKHNSRGIAVVAHHDCAGNPRDEAAQHDQLERAVAFVAKKLTGNRVVGLWVGPDWSPRVVCSTDAPR